MTEYEAQQDRPLLPDELAQRPDAPATERVPSAVAAELSEQRLYIAGAQESLALRSVAGPDDRDGEAVHELVLPGKAIVGRPGRTAERLEREAVELPSQNSTEPMCPPFMPQAFQPRHASESAQHAPMRRFNGEPIEPCYGVYGADDRQVFYPNAYPWHCVGRIFTWTNFSGGGGWNWWGSGALVGPRAILTAGHVCPWNSGDWAMLFVPGYWDGSSVQGAGAPTYISDYRGWNTNNTVAGNDVAVLRPYNAIGSSLGWMGAKVYDPSWQGGAYWTHCGYPGAVAGAERPSYQSAIPVLDDDASGDAVEIEHHGDITGGDSGGPFFGWWDNAPYAIGTTSGGQSTTGSPFGWWDEDNNVEAGGRAMVDLVIWAQNNWPA